MKVRILMNRLLLPMFIQKPDSLLLQENYDLESFSQVL